MCCGRPFLVHGVPRVAPIRETGERALRLAILDPHTARALADAWLADAQMEHASVAAFSRFALQLMALGAPVDLLADAIRAGIDEVKHAELCFGLAASISGVVSRPMPLEMDGVLEARTLGAVIAEVVVEGCIGETVAAVVASRELECATDPRARHALERIANDEARHAELAWRFMRWAVDTGGDEARATARMAFRMGMRSLAVPEALTDVDEHAWHAHGRLLPSERVNAQTHAMAAIIAPCAQALFGLGRAPAVTHGTPLPT